MVVRTIVLVLLLTFATMDRKFSKDTQNVLFRPVLLPDSFSHSPHSSSESIVAAQAESALIAGSQHGRFVTNSHWKGC